MSELFQTVKEVFVEYSPLTGWLHEFGLSENLSMSISGLLYFIMIIALYRSCKFLYNIQINRNTAKELASYEYTFEKVEEARLLYIETQFQDRAPSDEDEIKTSKRYVLRDYLIPWFIKTAFNEKKSDDKFYLILGDSGMGKTTFLINLFIRYKAKYFKKYAIKLLNFGDDRILDQLKKLSEDRSKAQRTILLLDAFDEYKGLLSPEKDDGLTDDERFRKMFDHIASLTRDFRDVVITSRTQYFPGEEEKRYELKIPRFDDQGFHSLSPLYISPFDDNDVKKYLNKKYGRFSFWSVKKHLAKKIVASSPKMMVRPMLLSYIDWLVDDNINTILINHKKAYTSKDNIGFRITAYHIYKYMSNNNMYALIEAYKNLIMSTLYISRIIINKPVTVSALNLLDSIYHPVSSSQVYGTLVDKWIEREAMKRKHDTIHRDRFMSDLYKFSELIALKLYEYHTQGKTLSIEKKIAQDICEKECINLTGYETTGQSLLTRDSNHNWKFAHKSIFEYLIARYCSENRRYALKFQFTGLDMAKMFFNEMQPIEPVTKYINIHLKKRPDNITLLHHSDIYISKYLVTKKEYASITQLEYPLHHYKDSVTLPIAAVNFREAMEYCNSLNKLSRYGIAYDNEGNLLDIDGNIINNISQIKGFRIPNAEELKCILMDDLLHGFTINAVGFLGEWCTHRGEPHIIQINREYNNPKRIINVSIPENWLTPFDFDENRAFAFRLVWVP